MIKAFLPILTAALFAGVSHAQAQILITEINSNGTGGDFFEIYNSGSSSVNLSDWKWTDRDLRAWNTGFTLNSSTLLAGEIAVIPVASGGAGGTSVAIAAFKSSWGLSDSVKLIGYSGAGAGLGDRLLHQRIHISVGELLWEVDGEDGDLRLFCRGKVWSLRRKVRVNRFTARLDRLDEDGERLFIGGVVFLLLLNE